jgi:pilus assembly protein Flp/PilA
MHDGLPEPVARNWETIMLEFIQRLTRRDEETGASAVEYGLLVAAIAALIVLIVFALGGVVKDVFTDTCGTIQSEASTTSTCG